MYEPLSLCVLVALIISIFHFIYRPLVLSPLAKIPPAHWSAPISPIWILIARKKGNENRLLHEAHQRLGPVVRVGPNDLSIDGLDHVRIVYGGGFEKDPWYSAFDTYGVRNMFSELRSQEHSSRKRMLANVYSKSYIQSSQALKAQSRVILFNRLLPQLQGSGASGIDVHPLFLATTMDFISAYVFGLQNGTNFIQDTEYRGHWLKLYLDRNEHHFWPQELPGVTKLFQTLGVWLYPRWVDISNIELAKWNLGICQKAAESNAKGLSKDTADESVVLNVLNNSIDKEINIKGRDSILHSTLIQHRGPSVASEVFDHVLAGQETAGITLTYICWHLSQSPELQKQLREELLTLTPSLIIQPNSRIDDPQNLPDAKQLDALPFLHAIVQETLRLHAPIPGPQARRTPFPSCTLNNFTVPGGVRVAALAYTLHRDKTTFPEPDKWDCSRWIASESTEEERRQRQRQFWAFGSGGRMCIGSNFAMNEMKNVIAAIYTNFISHIVDDTGMEQTDGYTSRPASESLTLSFEPVNRS